MRLLAYTVLWLLAMALLSFSAPGFHGGPARAQTPTPIPNYRAGAYQVTLDCGSGHVVDATITFTKDGTPKGNVTLHCPPQAITTVNLSSDWNDLEVSFRCDVTPVPTPSPTATPVTLQVPSGTVILQHEYYLSCALPGTPTPTPGPGNPYVVSVIYVGGIAEAPSLAESSAGDAIATGQGSGWPAGAYFGLAAGAVAAALVLSAGVVYARRRRLS